MALASLVPTAVGVFYLLASLGSPDFGSNAYRSTKRAFFEPDQVMENLEWLAVLEEAFLRIRKESVRLKKLSNALLGMGLILVGASVSIVVSLSFPESESLQTLTASVDWVAAVSRLAPIAFLQLIGAVFLRMHSRLESDLKQNKNELTNLDYRAAAGVALAKNKTKFSLFALRMATEERNIAIRKDEKSTTAEGHDLDLKDLGAISQILNLVAKSSR